MDQAAFSSLNRAISNLPADEIGDQSILDVEDVQIKINSVLDTGERVIFVVPKMERTLIGKQYGLAVLTNISVIWIQEFSDINCFNASECHLAVNAIEKKENSFDRLDLGLGLLGSDQDKGRFLDACRRLFPGKAWF